MGFAVSSLRSNTRSPTHTHTPFACSQSKHSAFMAHIGELHWWCERHLEISQKITKSRCFVTHTQCEFSYSRIEVQQWSESTNSAMNLFKACGFCVVQNDSFYDVYYNVRHQLNAIFFDIKTTIYLKFICKPNNFSFSTQLIQVEFEWSNRRYQIYYFTYKTQLRVHEKMKIKQVESSTMDLNKKMCMIFD